MDIEVLSLYVMIVCMIAIYRKHGKDTDQRQTLTQYIGQRDVIRVGIVSVKSQNTSGKRIHHILAGRLHDHVPDKICGQRSLRRQDSFEMFQLVLIGKHAKQQQISNFLKAKPSLTEKSLSQIVDVIPAVIKLSLTGNGLTVHHLG